ncbi:MAG: efflux RND transporter periplasmic adaptor subunit [Stellaceae bacterium]
MIRRALLLCAVMMAAVAARGAAAKEPSVLVQTTALHRGRLPSLITAYGTVAANPMARQTVVAPLAAVVEQVYVRQGELVAKDAPLVRIRPNPTVASAYAQAQAAVRAAHIGAARTRKLVGQHLATRQQLAAAENAETDARATLAALSAQGAGGVTILRAPFRAVVTVVSTSAGALAAEGTALLDLARPEALVLRVGVMPAEAAAIKVGDPAAVTPLGERAASSGKVLAAGSVVEASSGLVPIEIAVPGDTLLAGEMAKAVITTGTVEGFVVPHAAILIDGRGRTYVVQAVNGFARLILVTVLAAVGDQDVIAGPLLPSAALVLAGNYQLQNGMKVRRSDPAGKAAP